MKYVQMALDWMVNQAGSPEFFGCNNNCLTFR